MAINAITTGFPTIDLSSASRRNGGNGGVRVLDGSSAQKLEQVQSQQVTEVQRTTTEAERIETDGNEKTFSRAHGVLRLLEAGHFKATAEARLRINFAEELGGASQPETEVESPNLAATFTDSISTRATELLSPFATDAESVAGLASLVDSFVQTASSVDLSQDPAVISDALRGAFDDFVASATQLLSPTGDVADAGDPSDTLVSGQITPIESGIRTVGDGLTTEEAATVVDAPTVVATDSVTDAATDAQAGFADAITILKAAFDDALSELVASLGESVVEADALEVTNELSNTSELFVGGGTTLAQPTTIDLIV